MDEEKYRNEPIVPVPLDDSAQPRPWTRAWAAPRSNHLALRLQDLRPEE
jgi:hypothetical protein